MILFVVIRTQLRNIDYIDYRISFQETKLMWEPNINIGCDNCRLIVLVFLFGSGVTKVMSFRSSEETQTRKKKERVTEEDTSISVLGLMFMLAHTHAHTSPHTIHVHINQIHPFCPICSAFTICIIINSISTGEMKTFHEKYFHKKVSIRQILLE